MTLRTYEFDDTPAWICGHWNGSPLGIASGVRTDPGTNEVRHHHPYCEYYVVLEGSAVIEVGQKQIPVQGGMILMVEPNETHQVLSVGKDGVRWIVIQELSEPNTKVLGLDHTKPFFAYGLFGLGSWDSSSSVISSVR